MKKLILATTVLGAAILLSNSALAASEKVGQVMVSSQFEQVIKSALSGDLFKDKLRNLVSQDGIATPQIEIQHSNVSISCIAANESMGANATTQRVSLQHASGNIGSLSVVTQGTGKSYGSSTAAAMYNCQASGYLSGSVYIGVGQPTYYGAMTFRGSFQMSRSSASAHAGPSAKSSIFTLEDSGNFTPVFHSCTANASNPNYCDSFMSNYRLTRAFAN